MVDIVYALGKGSKWSNNEIKYSIRSIEKHVSNYRNIYIVGEFPDFFIKRSDSEGAIIDGIIHIPAHDKFGHERNIMEKIKKACQESSISESFMFINDDHFFLKDVDCSSYPYYYNRELIESIQKRKRNDEYKDALQNTLYALANNPKNSKLNYDIHVPILYDKKLFIKSMDHFNWEKYEFVVKSLYVNTNNINGMQLDDCKITGRVSSKKLQEQINGRHLFSIGNECLNPYPGEKESSVKVLLTELYPNKSKYEK